MEEKTQENKRRVNIVATVKIPTKVRITYEITDEEKIMPILEQILEQRKKNQNTTSRDDIVKKTVPLKTPRKPTIANGKKKH